MCRWLGYWRFVNPFFFVSFIRLVFFLFLSVNVWIVGWWWWKTICLLLSNHELRLGKLFEVNFWSGEMKTHCILFVYATKFDLFEGIWFDDMQWSCTHISYDYSQYINHLPVRFSDSFWISLSSSSSSIGSMESHLHSSYSLPQFWQHFTHGCV